MSFVELYINDLLIDLDGAKIQTDYSIAEIGAFETRNGFRGIDFDIPKTANNKTILENPDIINNTSSKPYRRLKARLLVDGIDQLIRFADIEGSSDKINVRLYGGITTFFDLIKKKELTELDLSTLNHTWDLATVIASRNNTTYIYPLIDYHADSPNALMTNANNDFNVKQSLPSVTFNTLLAGIVGGVGYALQNNINLFDLQYINNLLLLPVITTDYAQTITDRFNVEGNTNITVVAQTINIGASPSKTVFINCENITVDNDNREANETLTFRIDGGSLETRTVTTYTAAADGVHNFRADILFEYINLVNSALMFISVVKVNGAVANVTGQTQYEIPANTPVGVTIPRTLSFDLNVTLSQGEKVFLMVIGSQISGFSRLNTASIKIRPAKLNISFGDFIYLQYLLPDLKQSDFFRNYLQMYCAIVQVDEFTKLVRINKFDDVLSNIGLSVDWSDKLDYSSVEEITYALDEYAITNRLLYADDDSVIKPIGTDGALVIDDETLEDERDFIELDYAATEQVTRLSGLNISQIKLFTTNDDSPPKTEITEEVEPRVLLLENISGSVDYTDGSTTTNVTTNLPVTWFIRADKTYNLGFANSLIPSYYKTLEGVLFRTKIIKAQIRLNSLDIYNLDFLKPVYIDKFNSYFYISKISGYDCTNNESTEVELVKIR